MSPPSGIVLTHRVKSVATGEVTEQSNEIGRGKDAQPSDYFNLRADPDVLACLREDIHALWEWSRMCPPEAQVEVLLRARELQRMLYAVEPPKAPCPHCGK